MNTNWTEIFFKNYSDWYFVNEYGFFWTNYWYLWIFLIILLLWQFYWYTNYYLYLELIFIYLLLIAYFFEINNYLMLNHQICKFTVNAHIFNNFLTNLLNNIHPFCFYFNVSMHFLFFFIFFFFNYTRAMFNDEFFFQFMYRLFNNWSIFIVIALVFGSWWALQEGSWGGWWNWDPSESLGLIPLIFPLMIIHFYFFIAHWTRWVNFFMQIFLSFNIFYFLLQLNFQNISHNFGIRFFFFFTNTFFFTELITVAIISLIFAFYRIIEFNARIFYFRLKFIFICKLRYYFFWNFINFFIFCKIMYISFNSLLVFFYLNTNNLAHFTYNNKFCILLLFVLCFFTWRSYSYCSFSYYTHLYYFFNILFFTTNCFTLRTFLHFWLISATLVFLVLSNSIFVLYAFNSFFAKNYTNFYFYFSTLTSSINIIFCENFLPIYSFNFWVDQWFFNNLLKLFNYFIFLFYFNAADFYSFLYFNFTFNSTMIYINELWAYKLYYIIGGVLGVFYINKMQKQLFFI